MKKLIIPILLAFPLTTFAFNDTVNHTYTSAIDILKAENVIQGDAGKNTFRPDDGINRAEITKILVFATTKENLQPYDINCFTDVKVGQWFTPSICYAKEKGWVKGYGDGSFKPAQNVTNFEGMKIAAKANQIDFTEGTPWYADLVETLSFDNLIPYTIYQPNANLTRAEMADLIVRIKKHKEGTLSEYLGDRKDINVTLETIEEGLDLTKYTVQKVKAN